MDIGTSRHRQISNVCLMTEPYGPSYCTALLGLYAFIGEDAKLAFKGKGKAGPLKKLQSHPKYEEH